MTRFLRAGVVIVGVAALASVLASTVAWGTEPEAGAGLVIAAFDSVDGWSRLTADTEVVKQGTASGRWSDMPVNSAVTSAAIPHDWSPYNTLSLWVHNEKRLEGTAFMLIVYSEREETEGPDYYALRFDLGRWTGWKRFLLPFTELGTARQPIGWHAIDRIQFVASGWGNTPNPEAVVRFDDFRLLEVPRVEGPRLTDAELFDAVDLDRPGLEAVKAAVAGGDLEAAKATWLAHLKTREHPKWTIDWRDRPSAGRRPPAAGADRICDHVIQGHDFGPDIDWSADPNHYREWTYSLNRFYHWRTLCEAYRRTGDERYAREFCDQLLDWVEKNPVPLFSSGNGSYTWRTIECGIRQSTTWPDCLYRVLGSESFTPEVAAVMTRSMVEHARHLMSWPSAGGNWLTMESNGLGTIGILLPEFREADQWRTTALSRQYAELDNQVYPDGAQIELTTGYHQVSLRNFLGLASTAKLNGLTLPDDYYRKLRRMFEYNLFVQMPDGRTPGLNDGGMGSILWSMETARELYDDPVFQWAATQGAEGTPPDHASHVFPYAGQMVMRSGWEPDARYLLMDAGPYGFGHQHEDKLSIVVHALGKVHVIDPGSYAYDSSPWRRYTIDTPAHNTVMVDGLPQRRRGRPRHEYILAEPPETNLWLSGEKLDYAAGQYDAGYGDRHEVKVVHRREVVFVKPDYWLLVDTLSGEGEHLYESLFHFDADEAEVDPGGLTVRTVDPAPNCLIAAAAQPGLELRIVKGQTEPAIQGFVAGQRWRPSWKEPDADPPEHGKREVPTAVFALQAAAPARLVTVIYPYRQNEKPTVAVEEITEPGGPVTVRVTLPNGTLDEVTVRNGATVQRTPKGGRPEPWASLHEDE